jgi:outer membrane protein TolC
LQNKNSLNQKEQLLAYVRANRLNDYFTLYKALGGQL